MTWFRQRSRPTPQSECNPRFVKDNPMATGMNEPIQPAQNSQLRPTLDVEKPWRPDGNNLPQDSDMSQELEASADLFPEQSPPEDPSSDQDTNVPLFPGDRAEELSREWDRVQAS